MHSKLFLSLFREYVARLVGAKGKNLQTLIDKSGVLRMRVEDDAAGSETATVQVVCRHNAFNF